jgi:hypothetical protein
VLVERRHLSGLLGNGLRVQGKRAANDAGHSQQVPPDGLETRAAPRDCEGEMPAQPRPVSR